MHRPNSVFLPQSPWANILAGTHQHCPSLVLPALTLMHTHTPGPSFPSLLAYVPHCSTCTPNSCTACTRPHRTFPTPLPHGTSSTFCLRTHVSWGYNNNWDYLDCHCITLYDCTTLQQKSQTQLLS